MPRLVHRLPQIRLHSPSGRARVRINGKDFWLGKFGSPESLREYDRLISEYLANGRQIPSVPSPEVPDTRKNQTRELPVPIRERATSLPVKTITITTLIARFTEWADGHYRHPDGTETREAANFRHVTRPFRKMFGTLPVADFGPTRLIAFREQLIKKKLARRTINRMLGRLRTVFRWGVSRELCSFEVLSRLQTVEPLQPNRGGREPSGTRGSVSWEEVVEKVLPFLPPLLQAFLTVLYHTGCRVGELRLLTTRQIDRSQDIWVVDLDQHKTSHRGKSRRIFFGPRAQAALLPWLLEKQPDDPIFSPLRVDERQPKRKGKRLPGRFYGRSSLQQVLRRAIKRAGVAHSFSLAQLRHSCAVRITDECSLDVARQVLGHERRSMTSRYARDSDSAARKAATKIG